MHFVPCSYYINLTMSLVLLYFARNSMTSRKETRTWIHRNKQTARMTRADRHPGYPAYRDTLICTLIFPIRTEIETTFRAHAETSESIVIDASFVIEDPFRVHRSQRPLHKRYTVLEVSADVKKKKKKFRDAERSSRGALGCALTRARAFRSFRARKIAEPRWLRMVNGVDERSSGK